jgi:superfamily II DNA or RNA helicase
LIATIQLIGEGFDCSGLTVLVLATPVMFQGRLTQVVGRILRPGEGKRPLVIDLVDSKVGLLRYRASRRWRE